MHLKGAIFFLTSLALPLLDDLQCLRQLHLPASFDAEPVATTCIISTTISNRKKAGFTAEAKGVRRCWCKRTALVLRYVSHVPALVAPRLNAAFIHITRRAGHYVASPQLFPDATLRVQKRRSTKIGNCETTWLRSSQNKPSPYHCVGVGQEELATLKATSSLHSRLEFPPPTVLHPPDSFLYGFDSPLVPPPLPGYPPPRNPVAPSFFAPKVNHDDIFVTVGTILGVAAPIVRLQVATERGVSPYLLADDWFTRKLIGGKLLNLAIFEYMRLTFKRSVANEVVNRCKDLLLGRPILSKMRFIYNPYVKAWEADNENRFPYVPKTPPEPPIDEIFFYRNPYYPFSCPPNKTVSSLHDPIEPVTSDQTNPQEIVNERPLSFETVLEAERETHLPYNEESQSKSYNNPASGRTGNAAISAGEEIFGFTSPKQPFTLIPNGYGSNGLIRPEYKDYLLKYWASRVVAYVGIYPNERVNLIANAVRAAGYGSPHDIMVEIRDSLRPLKHRAGEAFIRKYFYLHDQKMRNASTANTLVCQKKAREQEAANRDMMTHILEASVIHPPASSALFEPTPLHNVSAPIDSGHFLHKIAKAAQVPELLEKEVDVSSDWLANVSNVDIHLPGVKKNPKHVRPTRWPAICKIVHPPPKPRKRDPMPDLRGGVDTGEYTEEAPYDRQVFNHFTLAGTLQNLPNDDSLVEYDGPHGPSIQAVPPLIKQIGNQYDGSLKNSSTKRNISADGANTSKELWWMRRGILFATCIRQLSRQCQHAGEIGDSHFQMGEIASHALSGVAGSKLVGTETKKVHGISGDQHNPLRSLATSAGGLALSGHIPDRIKQEIFDLIFGNPVLMSQEFTNWIVPNKLENSVWKQDPRFVDSMDSVRPAFADKSALEYYGPDGAERLLKHRKMVLDSYARSHPGEIADILIAMRRTAGFPLASNLIAAVLRLCHQMESPKVPSQQRVILELKHFCNSGYGDPLSVILHDYTC